eukprot:3613074-Prymnesium_polylepis.1
MGDALAADGDAQRAARHLPAAQGPAARGAQVQPVRQRRDAATGHAVADGDDLAPRGARLSGRAARDHADDGAHFDRLQDDDQRDHPVDRLLHAARQVSPVQLHVPLHAHHRRRCLHLHGSGVVRSGEIEIGEHRARLDHLGVSCGGRRRSGPRGLVLLCRPGHLPPWLAPLLVPRRRHPRGEQAVARRRL